MVIDKELSIGDLSGFVLYTITMSVGLIGIGNNMNTTITATGVAEKVIYYNNNIFKDFFIFILFSVV